MTDPLLQLHDHLRDRDRGFTDLPPDEKRRYMAEAKRRQRERERAAREKGDVPVTAAAVDAALRDAALMLLATGGPGAKEIRNALGRAFPGKPGVAMSVETKARAGRLRPKMIKV